MIEESGPTATMAAVIDDFVGSHSMIALFLLVLTVMISPVLAQDVTTCGGYIKLSTLPTSNTIDLSRVRVNLFTATSHLLKLSTDPSPAGYYLIPLYDSGHFTIELETPNGWSYAPISHAVGTSASQCQSDLNFIITGFAINGSVTSAAAKTCQISDGGPAGVVVRLASDSGQTVTTSTSSDGRYSFTGIAPGTYQLNATHPTAPMSSATATVTVTTDNALVPTAFIVDGYAVSGQIFSEGKPATGAAITITPCTLVPSSSCTYQADPLGQFDFSPLACGQYTLTPSFPSRNNVQIKPPFLTVNITNDHVDTGVAFSVVGFTIIGRVLNAKKPMSDITVNVYSDATKKTETLRTNDAGEYRVAGEQSGLYDITAVVDGYTFTALNRITLTPATQQIADITVETIQACGRITLDSSAAAATHTVKVTSSSLASSSLSLQTDKTGAFCFFGHSGQTYTITPHLSNALDRVSPVSRTVTIDHPIHDLHFSRIQVTISGDITLHDDTVKRNTPISVSLTGNGVTESTHIIFQTNTAEFIFKDISPGTYTISIHSVGICWLQSIQTIIINDKNITNINFRQNAYEIKLFSTHSHSINIKNNDKSINKSYIINTGQNAYCFEHAGDYTITPSGCYVWSQAEYIYHTASTPSINLTVDSYIITGTIHGEDSSNTAVVTVVASIDGRNTTVPTSVNKQNKRDFDYSISAAAGTTITIIPQSTDAALLFYPAQVATTVASSTTCQPPFPVITSRRGRIIVGHIDPPVKGVTVTVNNTGVISVLTSDERGQYRLGPLREDAQITVSAVLAGYSFIPSSSAPTDLTAVKLASIDILVSDGSDIAVPNVLLSLSSESYRQTATTDDSGRYSFTELVSGKYYIRPLLKEWEFEPATLSVAVEKGVSQQLSVRAKRVAWSLYGLIHSLSGVGERGVTIEARSTGGEQNKYIRFEECVSDENGSFRLRGLVPQTKYAITPKLNGTLAYFSPETQIVEIESTDTHNVTFLAFRRPPKARLSGFVTVAGETDNKDAWLDGMEIQVTYANRPGQIVRSHTLTRYFPYFEFMDLSDGAYAVVMKARPPLTTTGTQRAPVSSSPHTVNVNGAHQSHIKLTFQPPSIYAATSPTAVSAASSPLHPALSFLLLSLLAILIVAPNLRFAMFQWINVIRGVDPGANTVVTPIVTTTTTSLTTTSNRNGLSSKVKKI